MKKLFYSSTIVLFVLGIYLASCNKTTDVQNPVEVSTSVTHKLLPLTAENLANDVDFQDFLNLQNELLSKNRIYDRNVPKIEREKLAEEFGKTCQILSEKGVNAPLEVQNEISITLSFKSFEECVSYFSAINNRIKLVSQKYPDLQKKSEFDKRAIIEGALKLYQPKLAWKISHDLDSGNFVEENKSTIAKSIRHSCSGDATSTFVGALATCYTGWATAMIGVEVTSIAPPVAALIGIIATGAYVSCCSSAGDAYDSAIAKCGTGQ